ncbi:hypothetical protein [Haloarchaeobius salinus]|uniref:hypothetical protein n=1 Tax=Haloarchaeobius salinus TaxID=1198298 RepID=UPI00210ECCC5|nr:hypothetical protein [Haloarchaeobius salinus]
MSATSTVLRVESFFGTLRCVDERVETLLAAPTYDDPSVYRTADEATSALAELGDALVAAAPFPSQVGRDDDGLGEALTGVLEAQYADRTAWTDGVPGGTDTVDALVAARRMERRAGELVVPLATTGAAARNWGPTLAVMRAVTEDLLARAETLARRSRAVDAPGARAACEGLSRMLASLRDVLVRASSGVAFVGRRTDRRSDRPLSFAEWAGGRLNGGDNA